MRSSRPGLRIDWWRTSNSNNLRLGRSCFGDKEPERFRGVFQQPMANGPLTIDETPDGTFINAEPPRPRIEAIRIVDMSSSNSWGEFAGIFRNTREAYLEHERAKSELKTLMPEDAKEAVGHGVRGKRSKSGAVSFDLLQTEAAHA